MALPSPFACAEIQTGPAQPEVVEVELVRNRKRARCPSADVDNIPLSKIAQHSKRQQEVTAGTSVDHSQVTLHRPTPHRPNASTPCCFGVPSATHPLQVRTASMATARPTVANVVPSTTTAAMATAEAAPRSSGSHPSDDDNASPQLVRSQECQAPAASDSSEVVSDNSQQLSVQPIINQMQPPASLQNLTHVCSKPHLQVQSQPYHPPSSYLQAPSQHISPTPSVIHHSSITPFTTYGYPSGYASAGSLSPATTFVVVSGTSPKRVGSPSDKYVAAVVQDAQGNNQHVTVAASAISTGGPSYVLPTTLAVPFTPINPMATQHAFAMNGSAQHIFTPVGPYAQTMPAFGGALGLGSAGGFSTTGLGLSSNFGVTQAGYNLLPQALPTMIPSIHVNLQDKAHCVVPSPNVRIY